MQNILFFKFKNISKLFLNKPRNCGRIETRNFCILCNGLTRQKYFSEIFKVSCWF